MKPLQYILEYARPHRRMAFRTIGLHFVMALLSMSMPQLVRQAIDHGLGEHNFRFLLFAAILIIAPALDPIEFTVYDGATVLKFIVTVPSAVVVANRMPGSSVVRPSR